MYKHFFLWMLYRSLRIILSIMFFYETTSVAYVRINVVQLYYTSHKLNS